MQPCAGQMLPTAPAGRYRVKAVAVGSSIVAPRIRSLQERRTIRKSFNDAQSAVATTLSVEIPTAEARSCIRFQALPSGTGQAIVVTAVAEGSSAEQAGVTRGMKLTGISDPVRRDEVWELQDRPSLRYIRDVLRMRNSPYITLRFELIAELLQTLDAAEGSLSLTAASSSSSSGGSSSSAAVSPASSIDAINSLASVSESEGGTIAERLQQQYEQVAQQGSKAAVSAVQQRQERRKSYMEQVGQRQDGPFFAILGASFLLPALVILAVAYSTGYLDSLYSSSLTNMR